MTHTKAINRYTLCRSGHCPQLLLKTCRTQQEIVLVGRILTFWKYRVQEEDEEKDSPVMTTACPECNWMDPQYQQKEATHRQAKKSSKLPQFVQHHQCAHSLSHLLNNDLLYLHMGSTGHYKDFVQVNCRAIYSLINVCFIWFGHLHQHMQILRAMSRELQDNSASVDMALV